MKIKNLLKSLMLLVMTTSIIFSSSYVSHAATVYKLHNNVSTYTTADNAANKVNSTGTYTAGDYFIYKEYNGMLNISKTEGQVGAWINPSENNEPTPEVQKSYTLVKQVPTYGNAVDASSKTNSISTYQPGIYYIYKEYNGMLNISKTAGQAGAWINPSDNVEDSNTDPIVLPPDSEQIAIDYASGIYSVNEEVDAYNTFDNALSQTSPVTKLTPGKYYIYESRQGMLNLSSVSGQIGKWINPGPEIAAIIIELENKPIENPELIIESDLYGDTYYSVFGEINGYSNSKDALYKRNSVRIVEPGTYYIYSYADNMLNVTKDPSKPGSWINPTENDTSLRIKPDSKPLEYVNKVGPVAQKLTADRDLYASVMIAQSMLESGYGTSHLSSSEFNNYFGIKGYFNNQAVAIHTYEYTSAGDRYSVIAPFKKYNSIDESFLDYTNFLTGFDDPNSWRYSFYYGVRRSQTDSFEDAANYLTGRYATSPDYGKMLINLINQYDLTRFDTVDKIDVTKIYNGWKQNGSKWTYTDASGKQAISEWKWVPLLDSNNIPTGDFNWKYFNVDGESIDQFYNENGSVWLSQTGPYNPYYRGWWTDPNSGYTYFFRLSSGTRVSGRQFVDGGWIYFRSSGTLAIGWQYYEGAWRYNDPANAGKEATSTWKWLPIEGEDGKYNWKYFNVKGESINQFYKENGSVWLSQSGPKTQYYKGWWTNPENNSNYYFRTTTGSMVTGKQFIDGVWRYFRTSGTQATGWQFVNGYWNFYRLNTGTMVTGKQYIDGKWYEFNDQGNLIGSR